jgi:hypothetical protein
LPQLVAQPPQTEEVCADLPAVGLRRGEARDPFRWLFGERVIVARSQCSKEFCNTIGGKADIAQPDPKAAMSFY